jgi:peptide chain release factor 1
MLSFNTKKSNYYTKFKPNQYHPKTSHNLLKIKSLVIILGMKLPLDKIIDEYNSLQQKLISASNTTDMITLSKKVSAEQKKFDLAKELLKIESEIKSANDSLTGSTDVEMNDLLNLELSELNAKIPEVEEKLLTYLTPVDERDDKNVLLELKAGAGGDESALFAQELLKSYQLMCQSLGFKFNITSAAANDLGGFRDVEIEIKGDNAFSWFKYEGGVHRVQRVPTTEKQGRVHTSTIAVIVSPLLEEDTTEFKLDAKDVEVEATTSQGAGGQSVNTTYSAIKVKHIPTGIEARCQDERNQQQNRIKALQVLTSRVYNHFQEIKLAAESAERKDQVGTMDRSEKIRTYNFPQDRLTDHRYNHNWNQLPTIMQGGISKIIEDIKKMEAQRTLENI